MTRISSSASGCCGPFLLSGPFGKGADIPARGGSRARERVRELVRELVDGRPRVHRTRTVASFVELAGGHSSHAPAGRLAALPAGFPFFRYDAPARSQHSADLWTPPAAPTPPTPRTPPTRSSAAPPPIP